MNQVRRGAAALEALRSANLAPPEPGEFVELEPGVFGEPPADPLEGFLGTVERVINAGETAQRIIRGRHYYGSAKKRGER